MDQRIEFLKNRFLRKTQNVFGDFTLQLEKLLGFASELSQYMSDTHDTPIIQPDGSYMCDQSSEIFRTLRTQLASFVGCFTFEGTINQPDMLNLLHELRFTSHKSSLVSVDSSPIPFSSDELSHVFERNRLHNSSYLASVLDRHLALEEERLQSQVAFICSVLESDCSGTLTESVVVSDTCRFSRTELKELEEKHNQLLRNLFLSANLEEDQIQLDSKRTKISHHLTSLERLHNALISENALLQLWCDIIEQEDTMISGVCEQMRAIVSGIRSLISKKEDFFDCLLPPGESEHRDTQDEIAQVERVVHLEQSFRKLLSSSSILIEGSELSNSADAGDISAVLGALKDKREQVEANIEASLQINLEYAQKLDERLNALVDLFSLRSSLPFERPQQTHGDLVKGDRLRVLAKGLCDPTITESTAALCDTLEALAADLTRLRLRVDNSLVS